MEVLMSVVIPVYNKSDYLRECLNSVLKSSFDNFEIVCVEDCSSDDSLKILEEFSDRDSRIKILIIEENKGVSYSRNKGIKAALGKYIFFLDADDCIREDALEKYYRLMEEYNAQMCFIRFSDTSGDMTIGIKGEYPNCYSGKELMECFVKNNEDFLFACGVVYQRKFIIDNNIIFQGIRIGEGGLLVLQSMLLAKRVVVSSYAGYIYNINETSTSASPNALTDSANGQLMQILFMLNSLENDDTKDEIITFLDWYIKKHIGGIINLEKVDEKVLEAGNRKYNNFLVKLLRGDYFYSKVIIDKEIESIIIKKNKVYLYGAGYEILSVIRLCNQLGAQICGIFVTTLDNNKGCVYGHKVMEFNKDIILDYSIPFIITTHKKHQDVIYNKLREAGVKYITAIKKE